MNEHLLHRAEAICHACDGHCCNDAHPPISKERHRIILTYGKFSDCIEREGYTRIRTRDDGWCVMLSGKKCMIHAVKPETCVAGPFTFAVTDHTLEIYLKRESLCPLVAHIKSDPEMYDLQFCRAQDHIVKLVESLPREEIDIISAIPEDETDLVARIPLDRAEQ